MWYLRNGRSVFDRDARPAPDDHRIYRPSTSRPPVAISGASGGSAVSSTTSMAASECGSTTLLLPSRHQPKLQPHAPKAPAKVPVVSTVSSCSSVAVSDCGSGSLLLPATPAHQAATATGPRAHKPNCRHHPDKQYLRDKEGDMRERNLLLAAPTLQGLRKGDAKYQEVPDDDESELETLADEEAGHAGRTGSMWPQVMAALSVSLGSMVVGFASAYTSPAETSMIKELNMSDSAWSWTGSLMPLGALGGGIAGGPLIEGIGRRTTILATAVPFIISWFLIALANNVIMVLSGRAIAGFCVGIASLSLPVYLGETVQPEVRGTLGLMPTTLGNTGILFCFLMGKFLDWDNLAMLGGVLPVPFLVCMFLIPETPRWYMSKGKPKEARKALQWLRGSKTDISHEMGEIERVANEAEKNAGDSSQCSELFSRANIKPLLITIGLMFFQQMSGINAVIFYATKIFKDAGSTIEPSLCTIIIGVVNFMSTFVATILIDRLGRKILLYMSSVGMTITLGTLGSFFFVRDVMEVKLQELGYGWIPLACLVIYVVAFSVGFGPVPWLMMGEILPANIRGTAASLATAFNWSCTFLVTLTFQQIMTGMGQHGGFWMFGTVCCIGLFFVIFFVPETQGKSLEDIEKKMTGQRIRRMSSVANLKPLPMAV
ncbi:facilitated trehalose transporter Tret1-like isoform X2 [Thrips palmi]|uniref:Facilitated trehalose transporter Tret1-like isoform X2 n=1 Tax=Thrips palmi TaxID=161013 RepID=A0A6P9A4I4_THRPL|nr:facilitated trehalose transporter Tret1-like isoform X2 [Thrips palmi]